MKTQIKTELENLHAEGRLRNFRPLGERDGCYVVHDGQRMLNMTSNDYLGIAGDKKLLKEFYQGLDSPSFLDHYGLGAASSRLLTGDNHLSHALEKLLCTAYRREACLLFNSGYHANIGILPTLAGKGDLILSDKLNHASIHDGHQLSRAVCKRFRHKDYNQLQELLENVRDDYERVIIVTESVFSMDGDVADLTKLIELKKSYDCLLYLDEAHGVGVYGAKGLGKAEEYGVIEEVDLLVGTFGKAYSSVGAYVLCNHDIRDYLINFSRSLIFTTALPPVVISWNAFIFKTVMAMGKRRKALGLLSEKLREKLREYDLKTDGTTNIVPVIIGDNSLTVSLAQKMMNQGFLIFAIRPPTVPKGTARFRLSLTATMSWEEISSLPQRIAEGLR